MYDVIIGRGPKDVELFGKKGAVFIGKQYVKMGQVTSLSNDIYMDVTRSHVVFVCGKRGGGKCLHGDTLITLNDGREIPIKDLENIDNEVVSLNTDLKVQNACKNAFFKRSVNKIMKITLRSGKSIKLTPEHPLLTLNGWTPAKELSLGSRIATPRKTPGFGEIDLPECEIKLLAYLIAEGHLSNNFVLFSNYDQEIVDDFTNAINTFDKSLLIKTHSKQGCFRITASEHKRDASKGIRNKTGQFVKGSIFNKPNSLKTYCEKIGLYGKLSKDKFIPEQIFKLTQSKLALFLNRLFSCDGTIYLDNHKSSWRISYCSASERMIFQVQSLLLKFGILSRIRKKKIREFTSYELEFYSENCKNFINEIGFFGKKQIKQKKAILSMPKTNPNVDTIPKEIWDSYRPSNWAEIGKGMGYITPKALRSSINYGPSRQKLLMIAELDNNEFIKKLATSDIFWDEIADVKVINEPTIVYDITVPQHHNFIANNIIVHNSYTMGVIAEGISDLPSEVSENIAVVMLDTMGIYWTMKYPNKQDEKLLEEWKMKPKAFDVKIFTPVGYYKQYKADGIPTDCPFSIKPSELDVIDWHLTFGLPQNDPIGVFIERIINDLKERGRDYSIAEIIDTIRVDEKTPQLIKDAAENRFLNARSWGLFDVEGTKIDALVRAGQVSVLDVSCYATIPGAAPLRALVIGLVAQKLFIKRMVAKKLEEYRDVHQSVHYFGEDEDSGKKEMPVVWLVIDEAHEFLPKDEVTPASNALITILREGRQPGISLILASQQPGKIHTDVMTQSDIVIAHRITARLDTDALGALMQSYMREGLDKQLDNLPRVTGSALIFDDVNERLYPVKIRPRFTWHGGSAPSAIHEKKNIFEL